MTKISTLNPQFNFAKITALVIFLSASLMGLGVHAQALTYTESFDVGGPYPQLNIPNGWTQGKFGAGLDPDNSWDRVGPGSVVSGFFAATVSPRTGTAMARYRAEDINPGESSFLASKMLDNRGKVIGATPDTVKLWMWRDNLSGDLMINDRIRVYVNDSATLGTDAGGATLLNFAGSTEINRSCSLLPAAGTCNAWNEYKYAIPTVAPYAGATASSVYIIILGTSAWGNHMFIDDFSVITYPLAQAYTASSAGVVFQNGATTAPNNLNQLIIGCKLTMTGANAPKVLTQMEFNNNGSTSPSIDISSAKLYYSGGSNSFDINTAQLIGTCTPPWVTNYMFLTTPSATYTGMTSMNTLEHGDNYFWILYDIPPGATPGNFVDAEWIAFTFSPTTYSAATANGPNPQTLTGNRLIDVVYCIPAYSAGTSWANYNNNDYVRSVNFAGAPTPALTNNKNWITSMPHASASENCNVGPYPKDCFYQKHGPDYELFAETGHPGYTVGRATTKTFTINNTYSVDLQVGTWGSGNYIAAFIDYNKDGDFTDPGERIAMSGGLAALQTYSTSFTIPLTATAGKTRLRVREVYADSNIDPCNFKTWGETEDYIITLVPDCPGFPGYTTWLGLTSNWSDPSNWCPAIAPITANLPAKNVRLPGGPAGAYTYVRPKITAGVAALANKLRVEANDTLFIDATTASSLTVQDSVKIWTPTSAIMVNTTYIDTAQVFNGALNRPSDNPLNSALRTRSFLAFTQADLLAQGLQTGDVVTNILIHLQRKNNGQPYKNLNVKYFYATNANSLFTGAGPAGVIPVPFGAPATPQTIFSGDLDVDTYVPGANAFGTVDLLLSTPFAWTNPGASICLIIEMCYDNTGFPSTGTNDEIRFTQTTSLRRYMSLKALTNFPKAACSLTPQDTVIATVTWVNGSTSVTVSSAAQAANILPGQVTLSGNVIGQVVSVAGLTVTMSNNSNGNGTGPVTFVNVTNTNLFYRPNLTFKYSRPYIKYPINVAGHWENNGTFVPAKSNVTLNGTVANQKVSGNNQTSFYDLTINNTNHVLRTTDFTVTDTLTLQTGRLKLNNGLVSITNTSLGALRRVAPFGFIQGDMDVIGTSAFPFSRLRWNMGSTTGFRTIPFISNTGTYIPMSYNIDAGTHDVLLGTYNDAPSNADFPNPEVDDVFGYNGAVYNSDGSIVVDRYFIVKDTLGSSPQADLTFRWTPSERSANNPTGATSMSAQRWDITGDQWEFPFVSGQTYYNNATTDSVVISNYTGFAFNNWWTVVGTSTPLPVSLLEFRAEQYKDKVKLLWTTASEINNSHFEIERTVDNDAFELIGRVESRGPGSNIQEYSIWDNNPVQGIQYYYLRQYDFDGRTERFGPVSARFSKDVFDILTTTVSASDNGLNVVFNYNSTEPYSYRIMDMTGRIIVAKDRNAATEGLNVIDINTTLAKGAYHIILQNSEKIVSRKFFY